MIKYIWPRVLLSGILFSVLPGTGFAAKLYKCKAADGGYSYQQTRCQHQDQIVKSFRHKQKKTTLDIQGEVYKEMGPGIATMSNAQVQTQLMEVLQSLTPLKYLMLEFKAGSGHWPGSLRDLNLSAKDMNSSLIGKVKLNKKGEIHTQLTEQLGMNKQLIIKPVSIMSGTSTEWHCYANYTKEQLTPLAGKALCLSRQLK